MRFAGATPRKSFLICHFILGRSVSDRRFYKIERYGPQSFGHYLRMESERDLDANLARWLKQAYGVGQQKRVGDS